MTQVYNQDPVMYTKQSKDEDVAQIFVEMLEQGSSPGCVRIVLMVKLMMTLTPEEQIGFSGMLLPVGFVEEALVKDQSQEDYKKKSTSERSLSFYR